MRIQETENQLKSRPRRAISTDSRSRRRAFLFHWLRGRNVARNSFPVGSSDMCVWGLSRVTSEERRRELSSQSVPVTFVYGHWFA